jgi:hypothetical protein
MWQRAQRVDVDLCIAMRAAIGVVGAVVIAAGLTAPIPALICAAMGAAMGVVRQNVKPAGNNPHLG